MCMSKSRLKYTRRSETFRELSLRAEYMQFIVLGTILDNEHEAVEAI